MLGAKVTIVSGANDMRRAMKRAMAAMGCDLYACALERVVLERELFEPRDIYLIDADGVADDITWFLRALYDRRKDAMVLMVAQSFENKLIYDLVAHQNLNHMIAKQGAITSFKNLLDEQELIVTCYKLYHRDVFGLEKYLPTIGVVVRHRELRASSEREEALKELESFLGDIECSNQLVPMVLTVADELLTNAVFNAPRDELGKPKYASVSRTERFELTPSERVAFRYACDGRYLAISVIDKFGSLNREAIVRYLTQKLLGEDPQIETKPGGAGIGLHMVFSSITQLIFNLQPGVRTEVIALFYVRSGMRAFKQSGRSLNIFVNQ